MSIGPDIKPEKIGLSKFDRATNVVKKTAEKYFERPLHYLFYGTLLITIIILFFGVNIKLELWLILGILASIKILNYFKIV